MRPDLAENLHAFPCLPSHTLFRELRSGKCHVAVLGQHYPQGSYVATHFLCGVLTLSACACLTACLTCRHSVTNTMCLAACRHGSGMTARESSSGSLQATPLQILRSQQQSPWGHLHSRELIDLNTAQRELMDGDDAEGEVELLDRRASSMPSLQVRKR